MENIEEFRFWCDSKGIKYFNVTYTGTSPSTAQTDIKMYCVHDLSFYIIDIASFCEWYTYNNYTAIHVRKNDNNCYIIECQISDPSNYNTVYAYDLRDTLNHVGKEKKFLEKFLL